MPTVRGSDVRVSIAVMWAIRAGLAGLLILLSANDVHARDSVTTRVKQLTSGSAFKVRLSAAVSLGKSRDPRAVVALAYAVRKDSSATIRRVAVAGLARIITRKSMSTATVKDAIEAIDYAAKDKNKKVRRTAKKAQKMVAKLRKKTKAKAAAAAKDEKMFLALGAPADPGKRTPRGTTGQISRRVRGAIMRNAPDYEVGSVSDAADRNRVYFVGATVSGVWTSRTGAQTEVRCKVTVRVSPMREGREHFVAGESASAKGTGRVLGSSSARAVRKSKRECVLAVAEQVTERQVVPFIQRIAAAD